MEKESNSEIKSIRSTLVLHTCTYGLNVMHISSIFIADMLHKLIPMNHIRESRHDTF